MHYKYDKGTHMKKYFIILMALVAFNVANEKLSAEEQPLKIETGYDKPFSTFSLSSEWKLEDQERNNIEFELKSNNLVTCEVVRSRSLKDKPKLDKLKNQILNYSKGKAKSIPILADAFAIDEEEQAELDIDSNISNVTIKKIEWIHVRSNNTLTITEDTSQGEIITKMPLREMAFISILKNRIYLIVFTAPLYQFHEYEELFMNTMQNLY